MHLKGIKETVIYVHDLERTKQFYQETLGLRLYGEKAGEHIFFKVGEDMLLFFNPEHSKAKTHIPPHFAEGNQHFALTVSAEDYESWKNKVSALIEIEHEKDWGSGVKSFYFRDPEQNSVEIVTEGMWDD
jgi:catechol 2,3-dioxygenase-like lactoylglutathione lyase family enzyme